MSERLAFVLWHRPGEGVDPLVYESALVEFHRALGVESAAFRLARLPFDEGAGYEDWYLAADWEELGTLNRLAVEQRRRAAHEQIAARSGEAWGSIYQHVAGDEQVPERTSWIAKPYGQSVAAVLSTIDCDGAWQRQMNLGPAPELCLSQPGEAERVRVY